MVRLKSVPEIMMNIKRNKVLQGSLKVRRRFFSIVEILIAILILISLVGVVGLNVRAAYRSQAYESDVDRMKTLLQRAQDMLLVFSIETEIEVSAKDVKWVAVGTLNQAHDQLIQQEKGDFKSIQSVHIEEAEGEKKEKNFAIHFLDNGFDITAGVLTLNSEGMKPAYFYLPGYPAPIKKYSELPDMESLRQKDKEFMEKLTESTVRYVGVEE